jgi:hypothetical protein
MDNKKESEHISPYIYGTTRLGDERIPFDERVNVAYAAMQSGVWFHTSRQYNNALEVLSVAFDKDRTRVPKLIAKIGGNNLQAFKLDIINNLKPIFVRNLDVGQLCLLGDLEKDFAAGGDSIIELEKIQKAGLVNRYVLEVFPWTSQTAIQAIKTGLASGLIDAFILYLNPLQRFASNELWDLLMEQKLPIISLRTVAGGPVHNLRDIPGAAWKEYIQKRAAEVAPVFERSGIKSWTEFCVRYAFSIPNVISTVGATGKIGNLEEFLAAKNNIQPLPQDIVNEIFALQYRWSDEFDIHAEPWTM